MHAPRVPPRFWQDPSSFPKKRRSPDSMVVFMTILNAEIAPIQDHHFTGAQGIPGFGFRQNGLATWPLKCEMQ
jgi:hypothetical protein